MLLDVLHISFEYFPAAKAGGLADVVGALPKYLNLGKLKSAVVIPKHGTKWMNAQKWKEVHVAKINLFNKNFSYTISKYNGKDHPLFVVESKGLFDRSSIYIDKITGKGYEDEVQRSIAFQMMVLDWLLSFKKAPKVLHCHDHHTGLIPFFIKYSKHYTKLEKTPTVFTIHNGAYHGAFDWKQSHLLPAFDISKQGLLDWNNQINPLATAIKCAWKVTTVSPGYMEELRYKSSGLETLIEHEHEKSLGVINGIDTSVWDPSTDPMITDTLNGDLATFKAANKKALEKFFKVDFSKPIITFIGRFAYEKGVQFLPDLITRYLSYKNDVSFLILGTGNKDLEQLLQKTKELFPENCDVVLAYDEKLAHQLYAGSDFLIMPSKVEPCGLNQMYAMRYGTIPIVHGIGGLKDTVIDLKEKNGYGIRFDRLNIYDAFDAVKRATELYSDTSKFEKIRKKVLALDFSWDQSAKNYKDIYSSLMKLK